MSQIKSAGIQKNQFQQTKIILFDFDGTLADSILNQLEIYNFLAKKYGGTIIRQDEISKLRDYSVRQLINWMKIPWWRLPQLLSEARELLKTKPIPPIVADIDKVIMNLYQHNYQLGIVTSNSGEYVQEFLNQHNLLSYFSLISSEPDLFKKNEKLINLVKQNNWLKSEVVYIGDEVRDAQAAKKAGVCFVGVSWGLNSFKTLLQTSAVKVVKQPIELNKLF